MVDEIEDLTAGHTFSQSEEKELCGRLIDHFPRDLFRNGLYFVFKTQKIFTFSKFISYLRALPESMIDVSALKRQTPVNQRNFPRRFDKTKPTTDKSKDEPTKEQPQGQQQRSRFQDNSCYQITKIETLI